MNPNNPAERLKQCRAALTLWCAALPLIVAAVLTTLFILLAQVDYYFPSPTLPRMLYLVEVGVSLPWLIVIVAGGYLVRLFQLNRLLWQELRPMRGGAAWLAFAALLPVGNLVMPMILGIRFAWRLPGWRFRWALIAVTWLTGGILPVLYYHLNYWLSGLLLFALCRLLSSWLLGAAGVEWWRRQGVEVHPMPPRRLYLATVALQLCLWLGLSAIWAGFSIQAARASQNALEKLATLHVAVTPAQFRAQAVPPSPGSYEYMRKLLQSWNQAHLFDQLLPIVSATPLPPEAAALLPALQEERREYVELLKQLPKYPHCDFRREWEQGYRLLLPELSSLRKMTQFQRFRILRALERRDRAEILTLWKQCDILADWSAEDGTLISSLVSIAQTGITLTTYEEALTQLEFTDAELRQRMARLAEQEKITPAMMRRALASEVILSEVVVNNLYHGIPQMLPEELEGIPKDCSSLPLRQILRQNQAFFLKKITELILLSDQPFFQIKEQLKNAEERPHTIFTLLANLQLPALPRYLETGNQHIALLRCARTALAAELYRRQHGKWPENAAELVPEFLDELPLDPFTGEALHFQRGDLIYDRPLYLVKTEGDQTIFSTEYERETRPGFRVYSNGPDGEDDNGVPKSPSSYNRKLHYDIGFSLYFE